MGARLWGNAWYGNGRLCGWLYGKPSPHDGPTPHAASWWLHGQFHGKSHGSTPNGRRTNGRCHGDGWWHGDGYGRYGYGRHGPYGHGSYGLRRLRRLQLRWLWHGRSANGLRLRDGCYGLWTTNGWAHGDVRWMQHARLHGRLRPQHGHGHDAAAAHEQHEPGGLQPACGSTSSLPERLHAHASHGEHVHPFRGWICLQFYRRKQFLGRWGPESVALGTSHWIHPDICSDSFACDTFSIGRGLSNTLSSLCYLSLVSSLKGVQRTPDIHGPFPLTDITTLGWRLRILAAPTRKLNRCKNMQKYRWGLLDAPKCWI